MSQLMGISTLVEITRTPPELELTIAMQGYETCTLLTDELGEIEVGIKPYDQIVREGSVRFKAVVQNRQDIHDVVVDIDHRNRQGVLRRLP